MTKPMVTIHNAETGEVIKREMNAAELAQIKADDAATQARLEAEATKAVAKAALLAKLGMTEDEARLLLG
jgi:AmiR/NasT family two-component response regulator